MTNTTHVNASEFQFWIENSAPGDQLVYATGQFARTCNHSWQVSKRARELRKLVHKQAQLGRVCLVQRPTGQTDFFGCRLFDYIAVKRHSLGKPAWVKTLDQSQAA